MNVLSLFDGMSCGQIALDQLGVKVDNYFSCEVDKYAIKATMTNYPNTIQLGDVCKVDAFNNLPVIDLVIGGSPCQGFSLAGKQLAFEDPRSQLFFEYVRILGDVMKRNPTVKFLLENVRMKKEYLDAISRAMGVDPICINSALVSAQNRIRYYWTNIPGIVQPEDEGILLKDIIEIKEELNQVDRGKSHCIDANYFKGGNPKSYFEKHRRQLVFRPCEPRVNGDKKSLCHHVATATDIKGNDSIKRVYAETGKAPTLTTMGGGHREPKILLREKSKCVRSSGRGSYDRHEWDSTSDYHYRKLTPRECFRLQTVPEPIIDTLLTAGISNSQLYKMAGNGWTVEVIKHIFSNL